MIVCMLRLRQKRDYTRASAIRAHSTFSKSLMVSVGVSKLGQTQTQLIFVDPAVKINAAYYCDVLLTQQLLHVVQEISGDFFILQQDSAPAHHARDTIKLLERDTPAFIAPNQWPSNSLDLNPLDYKIWGEMQQRIYKTMTWTIFHDIWMHWSSVLSMCGIAWDKTSSMTQLMSGANACVRVFVPKEDISSICFGSGGRMSFFQSYA